MPAQFGPDPQMMQFLNGCCECIFGCHVGNGYLRSPVTQEPGRSQTGHAQADNQNFFSIQFHDFPIISISMY
jgi:hypothetical protein